MSVCPDCNAGLKRGASKCSCGWVQPAKALPPRQQAIAYDPPVPPTPEERAYAAKCFDEIRRLTNKLKVDYATKQAAQPMTIAEKIMSCRHLAKSEPFSAARFGVGGHARKCLDCGKVDFVQLAPDGVAAMHESERERDAMQGEE